MSMHADVVGHVLDEEAFLPPSLLIDLYMPTATCFIFMCVCVCVCVCQLGVRVGTGRDGIKGR